MILLDKKIPADCEIILHGDTHEGNAMVHHKGLQKLIQYIKARKECYWVHMGDWIEAIMADDKRYQFEATKEARPLRQVDAVVELYRPIAEKCLVGLGGNHEFKLQLFGDLAEEICKRLGMTYGTYSAKLSLSDSNGQICKMFLTHGFRGALSSNAKDYEQQRANIGAAIKRRLVHKAGDCLVMALGHTHYCMVVPPSERLILADDGKHITQRYLGAGDGAAEYIEPDRRWYVNTGSFLKTYEVGISGYAERAGYDPVELGYVSVKIRDRKIVSIDRVLM